MTKQPKKEKCLSKHEREEKITVLALDCVNEVQKTKREEVYFFSLLEVWNHAVHHPEFPGDKALEDSMSAAFQHCLDRPAFQHYFHVSPVSELLRNTSDRISAQQMLDELKNKIISIAVSALDDKNYNDLLEVYRLILLTSIDSKQNSEFDINTNVFLSSMVDSNPNITVVVDLIKASSSPSFPLWGILNAIDKWWSKTEC